MRSPPLANSFWIEPGRLLAGEYPGAADRASIGACTGIPATVASVLQQNALG